MNTTIDRVTRVLFKMPLPLLLITVFVAGYLFKGAVSSSQPRLETDHAASSPESASETWTCSMHPQIQLPQPGKCPICSMKLVRQQGSATPAPRETKAPKYACSMFCVPPLPLPGKCPICGMEMVEVEDMGGDDDANARTLTLSPSAQKLAEIATVPVERKTVSAEIRMVGKIDYDETRLGYITAWVPGRLDRLYVDYTGVPVQKGDHMVYLYSPELSTAQTELLEALQRVKPSIEGSPSLLNERAEAWLVSIREKFRLWGLTDAQIAEIETRGTPSDYMTIYSPMGGIVIHKNVLEGSYVETGTRIYTIADLTHLWIKLDAYESDLAWLRYGQRVDFETEAYPGETFTGTVAFIAPVLDAKTRTVKVRVNVENADGRLKPEMFVRAVVHSEVAAGGRVVDAELAGKWMCPMHPEEIREDADSCDRCGMPLVRTETLGFVSIDASDLETPLVIPASAPLITGKRAVVYVSVPNRPGTYEGREIRLGPRVGKQYIVLDGLAQGERVVVSGNFKIDSAMQIMGRPSMMSAATEAADPANSDQDTELPHAKIDEPMPSPREDLNNPITLNSAVTSEFMTEFLPVLQAYLRIQDALSHDRHPPAREAARALHQILSRIDESTLTGPALDAWRSEAVSLTKSAGVIVSSSDLQNARAAFALLSESMIVATRRFGTDDRAVHRFHCPMAFGDRGADWLQRRDKTENPFFGSSMFRCGVKQETITPTKAGVAGDD